MARKLCFVNYKGGVGKTSIVVNLGASLACRGKRVLIVDCDAQANASIWLMRLNRWNELNSDRRRSLFAAFLPGGPELEGMIVKDVVASDNGEDSLLPGLDLIPTTFNLMDLEHDLKPDPEKPFYELFAEKVGPLDERYDFILFDCPPNVFYMTQCALYTCDEVFLPANPDALSLIGLSLFVDKAVKFHAASCNYRHEMPHGRSKLCGVILNAVKESADYGAPVERMGTRLQHMKLEDKVAAHAKVLDTRIRDAICVRRSVSMGLPAVLLASREKPSQVRNDYIKLAKEVETHVLNAAEAVVAEPEVDEPEMLRSFM